MEVRFISANDHYDSEDSHQKTMSMNLAFKTLVNDLYSTDLSVKVKSSLTSKKERGIYCSGNCPFGYRKKADDRNQVEIVEEEAEVVREIFEAVRQTRGKSKSHIAKKSHVLQGKLVCGECGNALRYRKSKNPYFYCSERYSTGNEKCLQEVNIFFWEQVLVFALQKEIRRQIELEEVWEQYLKVQEEQYCVEIDELHKSQQDLKDIRKEQVKIYEQYGEKVISKEEHIKLKERLQKKENSMKSEIQKQEMRLIELETELHADIPEDHIIWKEYKFNELNQEVADTFIKKVKVWMSSIWRSSGILVTERK